MHHDAHTIALLHAYKYVRRSNFCALLMQGGRVSLLLAVLLVDTLPSSLCGLSLSSKGFFFFQAEDGIRDFCLSRGLGDVYKRQDYRGI